MVMTFEVTLRITMTSSGFEGKSWGAIIDVYSPLLRMGFISRSAVAREAGVLCESRRRGRVFKLTRRKSLLPIKASVQEGAISTWHIIIRV
jgi:hypothetical protein